MLTLTSKSFTKPKTGYKSSKLSSDSTLIAASAAFRNASGNKFCEVNSEDENCTNNNKKHLVRSNGKVTPYSSAYGDKGLCLEENCISTGSASKRTEASSESSQSRCSSPSYSTKFPNNSCFKDNDSITYNEAVKGIYSDCPSKFYEDSVDNKTNLSKNYQNSDCYTTNYANGSDSSFSNGEDIEGVKQKKKTRRGGKRAQAWKAKMKALSLENKPNPEPKATPQPKKKYKTEMCKNYIETGKCSYSIRCRFAHGVKELVGNTNIEETKKNVV